MSRDSLADGIYIAAEKYPESVYRVDVAAGIGHEVQEDGSDAFGVDLSYFYVSDGYKLVAKPEKPKPHEIPGTLLRSPNTGNIVKVRSDGRLSYVHVGEGYGPPTGEIISATGVFPSLAKWAPVKAVTKTEYVPA